MLSSAVFSFSFLGEGSLIYLSSQDLILITLLVLFRHFIFYRFMDLGHLFYQVLARSCSNTTPLTSNGKRVLFEYGSREPNFRRSESIYVDRKLNKYLFLLLRKSTLDSSCHAEKLIFHWILHGIGFVSDQ